MVGCSKLLIHMTCKFALRIKIYTYLLFINSIFVSIDRNVDINVLFCYLLWILLNAVSLQSYFITFPTIYWLKVTKFGEKNTAMFRMIIGFQVDDRRFQNGWLVYDN